MSDAMRVCPRHESAHPVAEPCPWCEPDGQTSDATAGRVSEIDLRAAQALMQPSGLAELARQSRAKRRSPGDGLGATHTWSPDLRAWVERYLEDA